MTTASNLKAGSLWRRWDPHIHSPGTALNDQFHGETGWEDYLSALETSDPPIEAIGVTDYYRLETYERVVAAKADGRLENIALVFPNIEMRLATGTDGSRAVNFHLLISPDDARHVEEARRFVGKLTFRYAGEKIACNDSDLMKLGRLHNPSVESDAQALRVGINQFKVEFDSFQTEWEASEWIRRNALIGVAAARGDGTSGLQTDASLAALRRKVETAADLMFSSSPGDRAFWLGHSKHATPDEVIATYGSLKPCLHGSDAHDESRVGAPDKDRFTWIKGDATFESLRQACLEPADRVHIGPTLPTGPLTSHTIDSVSVRGASWFPEGRLPINPGLVGIIGARGSGKTALADMIAAGALSLSAHVNERSFLKRAQEYIGDEEASITWADGSLTGNALAHVDHEDLVDEPRVRYLSQQFVETLCSASGATDELVAEIERVIFSSHTQEARKGATSFTELLDATAALGRQKREGHEWAVSEAAEAIAAERKKLDSLKTLKAKKDSLDKSIDADEKAKSSLITKDDDGRAEAFDRVSNAVEDRRQEIGQLERRKNALSLLQQDVKHFRNTASPAFVRSLVGKRSGASLADHEWKRFETDFVGDVDALLTSKLAETTAGIAKLTGSALPSDPEPEPPSSASETSLLPADTRLGDVPLAVLNAEAKRLEALIGADRLRQKQYAALTRSIAKSNTERAELEAKIKDAEGASNRIKELMVKRAVDYAGVFNGVLTEEEALRALYKPLAARLAAEEGASSKLAVSIKRHVDVKAWADAGEDLLDLRRGEGFRGRGALLSAAAKHLEEAWTTGDGDAVTTAMTAFREAHTDDFRKSAPFDPKKDLASYRAWSTKISSWIYGTDHISVSYSLTFDGVEIERLSPGTRGIVLLLLYLAIDLDDDRPLIIDQPEENLDPKSIFDELVERFRSGKQRRQIIIVTHNANLIVNADAEQVVIASCGPHESGGLPRLSYESGGLEDPHIRAQVCNILEGGQRAFLERAKRLRVDLIPRSAAAQREDPL